MQVLICKGENKHKNGSWVLDIHPADFFNSESICQYTPAFVFIKNKDIPEEPAIENKVVLKADEIILVKLNRRTNKADITKKGACTFW